MGERRRIVLKMSGEALASSASDETIDAAVVEQLAVEIAHTREAFDLELAVMVGGGNIWRGTTGAGAGMDRATSDAMGMLGTVINALALQDALEHHGQSTRVLSAVQMAEVAEPYIRRAGHPSPREGPGGRVRRRHGEPVLHHRHLGRPAGRGDRGRPAVQGDPRRGGRRLQRRPPGRPRGHPLRRGLVHGGGGEGPAGHGPHRHHVLHGQRPAHPGVRPDGSPATSSGPSAASPSAPWSDEGPGDDLIRVGSTLLATLDR